jgi:two-component system, OmpR family, sensor histidine kinase VicK
MKRSGLQHKINGYAERETALNHSITEQSDLISKLRLAEEKSAILSAIVESSDDAIISKDLNGFITSWNPAAERIFGYTPTEIVGQSILKLIPADRKEEEPKILDQLRKGIRVDHFETKRLTKEGKLIDVSLTISPVRDESGAIIGLSKIARDITDQRYAGEQTAMLAAIVQSTDDVVISKNLHGIITSWNPAAQRIFGYSAEEMIGESILRLIPDDRKDEEPKILAQLARGEKVDHFETKRITKTGTLIDVSLTISPVKDKHGNIIGVSKIARDITDQKLEQQRKNDFIAIVSHELKTPLTSIKSYIQLLLAKAKKESDSFGMNALTRAEAQVKKMVNMIHDFLNVSRLEQGGMRIEKGIVDLTEIISQVIEEGRLLSPLHTFEFQYQKATKVHADGDKIDLVLTNLISNAIKYAPNGGRITVTCTQINGKIKISITDEGVGIHPEDQKHLFKRFYRVKDTDKNVTGFGIGLYLTAEILRAHDAEITVKSEPDRGSEFSFLLDTI